MPPEVEQRVLWFCNALQGTLVASTIVWYPKGQFSRAIAWTATQCLQDPYPDVWRKAHTENYWIWVKRLPRKPLDTELPFVEWSER